MAMLLMHFFIIVIGKQPATPIAQSNPAPSYTGPTLSPLLDRREYAE
jgi:hypothetical protein